MSKYCANCNQFVNDDDAFCPNCGSSSFVAEENGSEQPTKKGFFKSVGAKLLYIALPILIAIGIVFMNIQPVVGFFIRTFGSPKAYLKYTAGVVAKDAIDDATDAYDQIFFNPKQQSVDATLSVEINEDSIGILSAYLPSEVSDVIDAVNDTEVKMYTNVKGDRAEVKYTLVDDGDEVVAARLMSDSKKGMMYVELDGISDEVLGVDMNDVYKESDMPFDYDDMMKLKEKILPKPKTVNKLLIKYLKTAINGLEDVEKDSEKVKIEGVSQKLTVLTVPCSEEQILNMVLPVLEEAEKDKDIKKILKNAQEALVDCDVVDEDVFEDDIDELFVEAVEEALDYVSDMEASDEEIAEVKVYVNGASKICGLEIEVAGQSMFSWISVEKGKKIATEISIPALSYTVFGAPDTFVGIKGEGTKKGNKIDAEYNVIVDDATLATLKVSDYNEKKAKDGYINGKFRLELGEDFYEFAEELGLDTDEEAISVVKNLKPYVEISLENTKKKSNFKFAVGAKDTEIVNISLNAKIGRAKKIKNMKADYEFDEAEEWASEIDLDKLEKSISKTALGKLLMGNVGAQKSTASNDVEVIEQVDVLDQYDDYYDYY